MMSASHVFEARYRDDKDSYLETFVYAAGIIGKHDDLPSETIDPFVERYIELYEQNHASRVEFMEEWGYGDGVPELKTEKDYTNWIVTLEEAALCGMAGGGLTVLLLPFLGSLAVPVSIFSVWLGADKLFDKCKEKLAEHYNKRLTNTPGYEQMVRFQKRVDQLIKDTVHEDTFG